jgi:acyl-[acyl carrier protein]--UDP-N-acetylglucosamine O-acyltransferase
MAIHIDEQHGPVRVEPGAHVENTAVLIGPCYIEKDAYIGHCAVIGSAPQHEGYYPYPKDGKVANAGVMINRHAVVREHCQVVGRWSVLATNTILGGHTMIAPNATFGQAVVTHPWVIIGACAMIGLNSSVIRDVLPFQKVAGSPAKLIGKNTGAGGDKKEWLESTILPNYLDDYDAMVRQREEEREMMKELKL